MDKPRRAHVWISAAAAFVGSWIVTWCFLVGTGPVRAECIFPLCNCNQGNKCPDGCAVQCARLLNAPL